MRIALIGATGMIGQRVLAEALSRGHHVTAIVRDPAKLAEKRPNLEVKTGDALKPETLTSAITGSDIVISSYGPPATNPQEVVAAVRSLADAVAAASKTAGRRIRLIVVGGAGSLEVAPGVQLVHARNFPEAWKGIALAARDALNSLRTAPIDWTYFSPAGFIQPGTRTGKYRLGTEQLVVDEKGESRISAEDYAVAMLDEIEKPQFIRKRFTVGY